MLAEDRKERILQLIAAAHAESLDNIKQAAANGRATQVSEIKAYNSKAFRTLVAEIVKLF
jgi:hypothetical protein